MAECGFVAVGERRQENTFFAEGESAVAGMPPPVFSDRNQTKEKKRRKEKEKEKERTKEKKRFIIYIFVFKR